MPKLRGHHLICLHFFNGEGYDQTFVSNLQKILKTLQVEQLQVVTGGDDVCRKCPYLQENACEYQADAEAVIREMDNRALALLHLAVGDRLAWASVRNQIPQIFSDWFQACCTDCEWLSVCEKNEDFRKMRPNDS